MTRSPCRVESEWAVGKETINYAKRGKSTVHHEVPCVAFLKPSIYIRKGSNYIFPRRGGHHSTEYACGPMTNTDV